jgi:hypothetical protein
MQDIIDEKRATDDQYDSDEDDTEHPTHGTKSCICNKAASKHPDWKWVISKQGDRLTQRLLKEAWKRDQDCHDEYFYNDFSGYGQQELMENEVGTILPSPPRA